MASDPGAGLRGHERIGNGSPTVSGIRKRENWSAPVECHLTDRLGAHPETGILRLRPRTPQPAYDRGRSIVAASSWACERSAWGGTGCGGIGAGLDCVLNRAVARVGLAGPLAFIVPVRLGRLGRMEHRGSCRKPPQSRGVWYACLDSSRPAPARRSGVLFGPGPALVLSRDRLPGDQSSDLPDRIP